MADEVIQDQGEGQGSEAAGAAEETQKPETDGTEAKPKEEATEADGKSDSDSGNEGEQQRRKSDGGFQRRIRELTGEIYKLRSELDHTRGRFDQLSTTRTESKPKEDPDREPALEDFETIDAYTKAAARFAARQEAKGFVQQELQKFQRESEAAKSQREAREFHAKWSEREATLGVDREVAASVLPQMNEAMAGFVVESELGPKILEHLANNPGEIAKLRGMSGYRQIAELGLIESKIAAQGSKPADATKRPGFKPPPKVNGTAAGSGFDAKAEKFDDPVWLKQWMEHRNAGKIAD